MTKAGLRTITSDKSTKHPDDILLRIIARWHMERATAMQTWARMELKSCMGTIDTMPDELATDAIESMRHLERMLSDWEPKTTYGAQALLEVAVEILAKRQTDPQHTLSNGPVLEIMANVTQALRCCDFQLKTAQAEA